MRGAQSLIVVSCLIGVSFACRPGAQSASRPTPQSRFPDTLDGFRFTASDSIPQRDGGGWLYRYSGRSGEYVTVFLYPIPDDVKATPDSSQWVLMEGRKLAQVMPIQVQRGRYDAYEVAFEDRQPVVTGRDTIPGFVAGIATRTRGVIHLEMEYVYLVHGWFLKVRATMPEKDWQQTRIALFAQDFVRLAYSH